MERGLLADGQSSLSVGEGIRRAFGERVAKFLEKRGTFLREKL
jgi:hypothetical protein